MLLYSKASVEIPCLTVLFTQQVVAFSDLGGASLGEPTRKVMQKVATNTCCGSITGKKRKNALDEKTPLCRLLISIPLYMCRYCQTMQLDMHLDSPTVESPH